MVIDWDEVVDETESETDEPAAAEEVDERTVGSEASTPEVGLPADD